MGNRHTVGNKKKRRLIELKHQIAESSSISQPLLSAFQRHLRITIEICILGGEFVNVVQRKRLHVNWQQVKSKKVSLLHFFYEQKGEENPFAFAI